MRVLVAHPEFVAGNGSSRYLVDVAGLLADAGFDVAWRASRTELEFDERVVRDDGARAYDVLLATDLSAIREARPRAASLVYAPLDWFDPDEAGERAALLDCDLVVRFTERAVRALESRHGIQLASKALASVFVPPAFDALDADRRTPDVPTWLWVGRLEPRKEVDFLLRAWARTPGAWRAVVCGDGSCRANWEDLAQRLGLASRVTFTGFVPDAARLYREATVLCTASSWEHYSLTILEAAACGLPTIGRRPDRVTVQNSCPEQIVEGETGWLFETEAELARVLGELATDPARAAAAGAAARIRKERSFTAARFRDELAAAIRERVRGRAG